MTTPTPIPALAPAESPVDDEPNEPLADELADEVEFVADPRLGEGAEVLLEVAEVRPGTELLAEGSPVGDGAGFPVYRRQC